ncbi:MAG: hypothetical protein A2X48_08705 [Lentisphaerae bacterium GWF2_49_21]|nr:MAG: hypothetical protein A2X48_08705 [Lentisphaerae bacterium GWF2_49_21]
MGTLCGIAIPEKEMGRVSEEVYRIKKKHFGVDFAKEMEIKGKDLFKNYVFRLAAKGIESKNLNFSKDLIHYIRGKKLKIFGCVCFEKSIQRFECEDVRALDMTFRYLFERIDTFMKIEHSDSMAKLIFDDRDYGINRKNSEAITNFFLRTSKGSSMDSIIKTPFFAISQSQNVGLQLADFVTTVIGLKYANETKIEPYYADLKKSVYSYYDENDRFISGIKVIHPRKEKTPGDPKIRGRDK